MIRLLICFILLITPLFAQPIPSDTVTIFHSGIKKMDYTSGNLDYLGENVNADASDSDTDWTIYKFTWVSTNCTAIQKRTGSWDARATYF